jgi:hypothetical protein
VHQEAPKLQLLWAVQEAKAQRHYLQNHPAIDKSCCY